MCSVLLSPCYPASASSPTPQQAHFPPHFPLPLLPVTVAPPSPLPLAPCGHKVRNLLLGNKAAPMGASADNYSSLSPQTDTKRGAKQVPAGSHLPGLPFHPYGSFPVWGKGAKAPQPALSPRGIPGVLSPSGTMHRSIRMGAGPATYRGTKGHV